MVDRVTTPGSAGAPAPAGSTPVEAVVAGGRGGWWLAGRDVGGWLPLLVVLVVQAVASVRLVAADTAFQDEADVFVGRASGVGSLAARAAVPPFASYFSGAPVIYPPLGALADSGGRAGRGAAAVAGVHAGRDRAAVGGRGRLSGRRAAFFSAALFAVLGPTLHLGAFATYDALSVFSGRGGGLVRTSAREQRGSGPDGCRRGAAGAGQRHRVLHSPVRPGGRDRGAAHRAATGRRVAARRGAALVMVLAALLIAGTAARREQLPSGVSRPPWRGPPARTR